MPDLLEEAKRIAESWLRDTEAGGTSDRSDTATLARAYLVLVERLERAELETEKLSGHLYDIALFRDGQRVDKQADLLREKARIAIADHETRTAYRAGAVAEIVELWKHYCDGELSLGALAQELGEALAAQQREVEGG